MNQYKALSPERNSYINSMRHEQVKNFLHDLVDEAPLVVRVSGNCMFPVLVDNSPLRIKRQRYYMPGDIIVFHDAGDQLIVHRLLGFYYSHRHGWKAVTRADNAINSDLSVPVSSIVGRAYNLESTHAVNRVPIRIRALSGLRFLRLMIHRVRIRFQSTNMPN